MRVKRYNWLIDIINENGLRKGAELGAATGLTTGRVLANCPTIECLYIADIWKPVDSPQWNMDNMEVIFREKFGDDKRVKILKGLSWDQAEFVKDNELDFIFIDADHSYEAVKKDIIAWYPKVRKGGIISGHDINLEGVKMAVSELLNGWKDTKIDHVWVYRK